MNQYEQKKKIIFDLLIDAKVLKVLEVARAVGVSSSYISAIRNKNSTKKLNEKIMDRFCQAFAIPKEIFSRMEIDSIEGIKEYLNESTKADNVANRSINHLKDGLYYIYLPSYLQNKIDIWEYQLEVHRESVSLHYNNELNFEGTIVYYEIQALMVLKSTINKNRIFIVFDTNKISTLFFGMLSSKTVGLTFDVTEVVIFSRKRLDKNRVKDVIPVNKSQIVINEKFDNRLNTIRSMALQKEHTPQIPMEYHQEFFVPNRSFYLYFYGSFNIKESNERFFWEKELVIIDDITIALKYQEKVTHSGKILYQNFKEIILFLEDKKTGDSFVILFEQDKMHYDKFIAYFIDKQYYSKNNSKMIGLLLVSQNAMDMQSAKHILGDVEKSQMVVDDTILDRMIQASDIYGGY